MAATRKCSQCGGKLPPPKGSGRPRTKCETCSPTRVRDIKRRAPHRLAEVVTLEVPTELAKTDDRVSLYATTHARLAKADLLEDPAGIAALILAEQLDLRSDSGASLAALARQHSLSLTEALSHAKVEADPVERLLRSVAEKTS